MVAHQVGKAMEEAAYGFQKNQRHESRRQTNRSHYKHTSVPLRAQDR